MYPVSIGYSGARARISSLLDNGHDAEALVTTAFTVEKTLRRTLRQIVVLAGFRSNIAEKIVGNLRGLDAVRKAWELYDPQHRTLTSIVIEADWKVIKDAAEMRNKLVHGERVFNLDDCRRKAMDTLAALDRLKDTLDQEYKYSGWGRLKVRKKSRLHVSD